MRASYSFITLLLVIFLTGCSVSNDTFRLTGKFKKLHTADIYIYSEETRDTIHIKNGKFVYEIKLKRPEILTIQYPNFVEMKIVAEPGKEAKFTADASDLTQTTLRGTEENELLSRFYSDVSNKSGENVSKAAESFVRNNPTTLAAEAVFRAYFAEKSPLDAKRTLRLLNLLLRNQSHNASLSRFAGRLLPLLRSMPGDTLPAFSAVSWKGDTVTDKKFRGNYLLLYYWASWQYESFQQVRGLREALAPYGDKIALVCVNLDYNFRSFLNTVRRDSLREYNVCDKLAWSSPMVRVMGVTCVPGNIIVSPEGKIIARDLPYSEMRSRIASLLETE